MAAAIVGGISLGVDKLKQRKQRKRAERERAQSLDAGVGSSSLSHPRDSSIPSALESHPRDANIPAPLSDAQLRKAREVSEERRRNREENPDEEEDADAAPAYTYSADQHEAALNSLREHEDTHTNTGPAVDDAHMHLAQAHSAQTHPALRTEPPPGYLKVASHEETVLDSTPSTAAPRYRRRHSEMPGSSLDRPFQREYREPGAIVPYGTESAERARRDREAPAVRGRTADGVWREPDGVWREGDLERPPSPGAREGETEAERKKRKVDEYWRSYKFWSLVGVGFAR